MKLKVLYPGAVFEVPVASTSQLVCIGKRRGCDIVVDLPGVAGRHLELRRTKEGWYARKLEEGSAVRRNGRNLTATPLRPGDHLTFADVCIEVLTLEPQCVPYGEGYQSPLMRPYRRRLSWRSVTEAPQAAMLVLAILTLGPVLAIYFMPLVSAAFYFAQPQGNTVHSDLRDDERDGHGMIFSPADRDPVLNYSPHELEQMERIAAIRESAEPVHERLTALDDMRLETERGVRYALDRASLDLRRELSHAITDRWLELRTEVASSGYGPLQDELLAFADFLQTSVYHRQIADAVGITDEVSAMLLPRLDH
jgi:hypothetical protein